MLQKLEELKQPTTRTVLQAYGNAERGRLTVAVYSPIKRKYPSIRSDLEKLAEESDPVAQMEADEKVVQWISRIKDQINIQLASYQNDREKIVNPMDRFVKLYEDFAPRREEFYLGLANAIQEFSDEEEMGAGELVHDHAYIDQIIKIVMPTRSDAEHFYDLHFCFEREGFIITKKMILLAQKNAQNKTKRVEIPTSKATEAFLQKLLEYRMSEFDRIYS